MGILRLNNKEREILLCAQLQANISVPEISRQTGYREHTVRYALQRMRDQSVISPYPFVNFFNLGYQLFEIYFTTSANEGRSDADIVQALKASPQVGWVVELGGDFQYGTAIVARHIQEVSDLLDRLSEELGGIFFEKSIAIRVSWSIYGRKYLDSNSKHAHSFTGKFQNQSVELDDLDHNILSILSNSPKLTRKEAANELGIPQSTLDYRVKRLEQNGVICGYVYSIDSTRFGMRAFRLLIHGKGINSKFSKDVEKFAAEHPHVVSSGKCIGSWDYSLGCEVEDFDQAAKIRQQLYSDFGDDINTVKLFPVFREPKCSLYPFNLH